VLVFPTVRTSHSTSRRPTPLSPQQRYHYYGRREEARRMELKSCDELSRRFGSRTAGTVR
jgi:hypothetical protein